MVPATSGQSSAPPSTARSSRAGGTRGCPTTGVSVQAASAQVSLCWSPPFWNLLYTLAFISRFFITELKTLCQLHLKNSPVRQHVPITTQQWWSSGGFPSFPPPYTFSLQTTKNVLTFRERGTSIHWLVLRCALPGRQTCSPWGTRECAKQLSCPAGPLCAYLQTQPWVRVPPLT